MTMRNARIKRERDFVPAQNTRLPLIGKIRIGEKRKNNAGVEYPVSLDYFIAAGPYAAKFNDVYKNPDKIQIVFISDDDFQSCYEEFDGRDPQGRRAGYGDGLNFYLWDYKGDKGQYIQTTNKDEIIAFNKLHTIRWKTRLTINFIIPAIKGVFGVWQLQTSGDKSSIGAIRDTYDEIKDLAGTIVNIPFDLVVKKAASNKPEMKTSYPVLSLIPNLSAENMETLRAFLNAGMDMRRAGILTESKLIELAAHEEKTDPIATRAVQPGLSAMIELCKTTDELRGLYIEHISEFEANNCQNAIYDRYYSKMEQLQNSMKHGNDKQ